MRTPKRRRTSVYSHERVFAWGAAVLLFVIGDFGTTAVGIRMVGATEAHPVGRVVLTSFGILGILGAKVLAILCVLAAQRRVNSGGLAGPVTLAVVGLALTTWNSVVIYALASSP